MEKLANAIKQMESNKDYREQHIDLLIKRFEEAVQNDRDKIRENMDDFRQNYALKVIRLLLPNRDDESVGIDLFGMK